ncbi:transposase [Rhizobium lemnae]|uniref:Transposase n=1 Tax=Rhizobium lemnae TaxID=1214924 RepID=A0ABV8E536_9HYPH
MEAALWIVRTGSPRRDLPAMFGNWSTAYRRFRDWCEADVFKEIFDALSDDHDMVDTTTAKAHRSAAEGTYGPPRCKRQLDDGLSSLHKCIRHVGALATAKMEIRAS